MPTEILIASEETKQFFSELSLPKGLNGNEVNGKVYWDQFWNPSKDFDSLANLTETYRRMQDFYDTINSGRFFLCNAQRSAFPEIYSGEPPVWANPWIKSLYLDSSIHAYSAAFDIYLQILWICYELFKHYPKISPSVLTDSDLGSILEACNINRVESQRTILGDQLCDKIKEFHLADNTTKVRNLCKQIKHRQTISYKELSQDKHPIMVKGNTYNSHNTLTEYTLDEVILLLKTFHKDLTALSNYTVPIVNQRLSNG